MTQQELMSEAVRLAEESVVNDWGGPFGAVIARDGVIVATGQNRVLLTGDITAHAEIEAIRKAVRVLNPDAPSIAPSRRDTSTLALVDVEGKPSGVGSRRARMLAGMEMYVTGMPCPMCMGAIYWARLEAVYFGCDTEATRRIGFDDAFIYEDFALPLDQRRIPVSQLLTPGCTSVYDQWMSKPDRHYY